MDIKALIYCTEGNGRSRRKAGDSIGEGNPTRQKKDQNSGDCLHVNLSICKKLCGAASSSKATPHVSQFCDCFTLSLFLEDKVTPVFGNHLQFKYNVVHKAGFLIAQISAQAGAGTTGITVSRPHIAVIFHADFRGEAQG